MSEFDIDRNGDSQDVPQIGDHVIKILVVGDQNCGKSTFIRMFRDYEFMSPTFVDHGANVYLSEDDYELGKYAFVEIPGVHNAEDVLVHHGNAKCCIFMYAVDDPASFDHVEQWIDRVGMHLTNPDITRILVGFKNERRINAQVIQHLAMENLAPITYQQGIDYAEDKNLDKFFESCNYNYEASEEVLDFIMSGSYDVGHL